MQSVRLNRLGTWVSLALLLVPVVMAGIADMQDTGTALGIPADYFIKAVPIGAILLTLLKGAQAVVTIITQNYPEEGSGRHGLSTYVNLALLAVPAALAGVMGIQDDAVLLGATPEMFGFASALGGTLLVLLKTAQAATEIVAQKRWEALEEPVPTEGGANEPPTP